MCVGGGGGEGEVIVGFYGSFRLEMYREVRPKKSLLDRRIIY